MINVQRNWYVVYSKPHKEAQVQLHLGLKGIESFFPRLQLPGSVNKNKGIAPLFPNYLFVRVNLATESHYFGTLTGIKKYNDYTNHWLTLANLVSTVVVLALVLLFTRSWRTVAVVSVPLTLTFVWWVGILPVLDIDLAFVYLIPTSFITSIGSDYAVHLAYNMHLGTRPRDVFRTVGKGVAFSSATALVSFPSQTCQRCVVGSSPSAGVINSSRLPSGLQWNAEVGRSDAERDRAESMPITDTVPKPSPASTR